MEYRRNNTPGEESLSKSAMCKMHPDVQIDIICYHSDCQQKGQQIMCACCALQSQHHEQHQKFIFPIFYAGRGFRLINQLSQIKQQSRKTAPLTGLQLIVESISKQIQSYVKRQLGKHQCLLNLQQRGGVINLLGNLKRNGDKHKNCCLKALNYFAEIDSKQQISEETLNLAGVWVQEALSIISEKIQNKLQILKGIVKDYLECDDYDKAFTAGEVDILRSVHHENNQEKQEQHAAVEGAVKHIQKDEEANMNVRYGEDRIHENCQEGSLGFVAESQLKNQEQPIMHQIKKGTKLSKKTTKNTNRLSKRAMTANKIAAKQKLQQTTMNIKTKQPNIPPSNQQTIIIYGSSSEEALQPLPKKQNISSHSSSEDQQDSLSDRAYLSKSRAANVSEHSSYTPTRKLQSNKNYRGDDSSQLQHIPVLLNEPEQQQINQQQQQIGPIQIQSKNYIESQFQNDDASYQSPAGTYRKRWMLVIWWVSNKQEIYIYLKDNQEIQELIVEDETMAKLEELLTIMDCLPNLKGLHLHCNHELTPNFIKNYNLIYVSPSPSYRHIQHIDISKYFPKHQITQPKLINNNLLGQSVKNNNIKNITITSGGCYSKIPSRMNQITVRCVKGMPSFNLNSGAEKYLGQCMDLHVLAFAGIYIQKTFNFSIIFSKCSKLHTLVFDSCSANHQQILHHFKSLSDWQLKHLKISGQGQTCKILLKKQGINQIFRMKMLQTLILINIECEDEQQSSSQIFSNISNLSCLRHLNLYGSQPIYSDLLSYLHPNSSFQLQTLNLGCSQINNNSVTYLSQLKQLRSLSIQYTSIGSQQLISITSNMHNLQNINIQNLNGYKVTYEQNNLNEEELNYGIITTDCLDQLQYKTLTYANIYNCHQFRNYLWTNYHQLQCVRICEGQLEPHVVQELESRKIKVFVEVQKEQSQDQKYFAMSKENGRNDSLDLSQGKKAQKKKPTPQKDIQKKQKTKKSKQKHRKKNETEIAPIIKSALSKKSTNKQKKQITNRTPQLSFRQLLISNNKNSKIKKPDVLSTE